LERPGRPQGLAKNGADSLSLRGSADPVESGISFLLAARKPTFQMVNFGASKPIFQAGDADNVSWLKKEQKNSYIQFL
jgi:hypothetical protein